MFILRCLCLTVALLPACVLATARVYTLAPDASMIGNIETTYSREEDTLLDIARVNGLGYQDIKLMNPTLDTWIPGEGVEVTLPSTFILPNTPKKGLVLNIPEMRLYFYSRNEHGEQQVQTFPLGVGREGWSTPYMKTRIIEKKANPEWRPPKSILEEHALAGDPLPDVVPAGPDNPLGAFAMRLGRPEYLIHGTNKPFGIGMRVSHGCIRLYPEDIEHLFQQVKVGTPVEIVNQPYKIGHRNNQLFLEVHPYLEEDAETYENNLTPVVDLIIASTEQADYHIDWDQVRKVVRNPTGLPVRIGKRIGDKPAVQVAQQVTAEVPVAVSAPTKATKIAKKRNPISTPPMTRRAMEMQENKLRLQLDLQLNQ